MKFKGNTGNWIIEQDKQFPTLHNIWSNDKSIFTNGTLVARTCYAPLSKYNALLMSKAPEMLDLLTGIFNTINKMDGIRNVNWLNKDSVEYEYLHSIIKEATEL